MLTPGTRLGPYEIVSPLGAGGMGEVFRARDTKLNRDVAIKVLPAAFAQDAERVARFRREAQVLASLNHPNIAAIHGLEESERRRRAGAGVGRRRRPRRAAEARRDPRRRSRCHREADRRRPRGRAREGHRPSRPQARESQAHQGRHGQDPRLRSRQSLRRRTDGRGRSIPVADDVAADDGGRGHLRHGGVHVPRAGARSEGRQARGHLGLRRGAVRDADGEEALHGRDGERHARRGAAAGDRLEGASRFDAARGPTNSWSGASNAIRRSVCATSGRRASRSRGGSARPTRAAPLRDCRQLPWLIALGATVAALALWSPWRPPAQPAPVLHLSAELGSATSLATNYGPSAILSPDGRLFAFVASRGADERPLLHVRRLEQLDAAPLAGTEGARDPFFSPDGEWIAFFADGKLKKVVGLRRRARYPLRRSGRPGRELGRGRDDLLYAQWPDGRGSLACVVGGRNAADPDHTRSGFPGGFAPLAPGPARRQGHPVHGGQRVGQLRGREPRRAHARRRHEEGAASRRISWPLSSERPPGLHSRGHALRRAFRSRSAGADRPNPCPRSRV